jgi:hypothetical protein
MLVKKLKKIYRFFFSKYWRIIYKFKYEIPFFNTNDLTKIVNPIKYIEGSKSVAIIGKGASIFESNPKKIIEECDCRILLSRVDVENLEEFIGNKFEIQISPQVAEDNSIVQVMPKHIIKKYGIKLLICNLEKKDKRFKIFYNFFHDRVNMLSYIPSENELDFNIDVYNYSPTGSLTIASSILRILYNVPSVEKIVFVGVDAYHFGYSQKQKTDGKIFFDINITSQNPLKTHGKPFVNFMIDTVIKKNKIKKLKVFFPKILKKYIDFPDHESFNFYE